MGGVTRIGRNVFTKEEGDEWISHQTAPICIVRLDPKTAELLLFYIGHRHKKEDRVPYPSAQDEVKLDELFLRMLTEELPHIDAFLYGAFPLYEAMVYREYAPQAVALSTSPWDDAEAVNESGVQRVRLDGGLHQIALGLALKRRGISSAPKN
jgi:hypothetical protein